MHLISERAGGGRYALLPHKQKIITLARTMSGILGFDVVVVDKHLNQIVNTFRYNHNPASIRINSVVGSIITSQKFQMVSDRKYFTDCVNCPDYAICELGGVFGTPIMCGGECIGAIALLVESKQLVAFQQKQSSAIDFLQQLSFLISEMVQNAANGQVLWAAQARFQTILDAVGEAAAITNASGGICFANQYFIDFFVPEGNVIGTRIDEILTQRELRASLEERGGVTGSAFYAKGCEVVRLRDIRNIGEEKDGPFLLYLFDRVDGIPFQHCQIHRTCPQEAVEQFFGKSPAMRRARQRTQRAMCNSLPALVECPDRRQADHLAGLLFRHFSGESRWAVKIDCSEDERMLEAILLDLEGEVSGALSRSRESVLCLYRIDHLPLYLQSRLVRFLDRGRDGGSHVRVIAVSYQDLSAQVEQGRFSAELYRIVSQNKISIPTVGGTAEDIHFYCKKYLGRYCGIYGRPPIQVSTEAWDFLEKYRWSNGIQEIREVCEYIVARLEGEKLELEDLTALFSGGRALFQNQDSIESRLRQLLDAGVTKKRIAEQMGISRATLYRWIEKFQLNHSVLGERKSGE